MRAPLLTLPGLLLALSGAGETPSEENPAAGDPAPRLVFHGHDAGLRDLLIRRAEVWHDAGDFLLAVLSPNLVETLHARGIATQALPAEAAGGLDLWLVADDHAGDELAPHARRLATAAGVHVLAVPANLSPFADGGQHACHTGVARVRREPVRPAPVLRWRGLEGARGIEALGAGDPRIQALVDQVDAAKLQANNAALVAIPTRRSDQPGGFQAQAQIKASLEAFGLSVTLQDFGPTADNVVAEIPGAVTPERIVVIGAHYDSIGGLATGPAPGADDNGSGTAAVIELARILATAGPFENTIRLMLFAAEEFGLVGSNYAAAQSVASGEEILAMLNMDMIAYRAPGDTRDVDFITTSTTPSLTDFAAATGALYVPDWAWKKAGLTAGTSDHKSFWSHGFPAAFFFEDAHEYYPAIHTPADTQALATNDWDLARMIARGVLATAATLAEPLDLSISHAPLADTDDGVGPYLVTAAVTSLVGTTVNAVDVTWTVDGTTWSTAPLAFDGAQWKGLIAGGASPVDVEYYLTARDDAGYSEVAPEGADLGAEPYSFFVGTKTVFYATGFEGPGDEGWTHGAYSGTDDWQRGTPNGKAGDPSAAHSGTSVWGNDLGAAGFNGAYPANAESYLRSPVIDTTGSTNLWLEFRRWLNVEDAVHDQAQIYVDDLLFWQNTATFSGVVSTADEAWSEEEMHVFWAPGGAPSIQVEFRLRSDNSVQLGGWNLDSFAVVQRDPAPPPPAPGFTLSPATVAAVGGGEVVAAGSGMGGVLSVTVGGVPVPFTQGAGEVRFDAPVFGQLGAATVTVTTAAGVGSADLNVVAADPPVLVGPATVTIGGLLDVSVGAAPDGLAWLLLSLTSGATVVAGLPPLEIGGGNPTALLPLGSGVLDAAGAWSPAFPVPANPSLAGLLAYFEAVTFDPAGALLDTSGVLAVSIDE